MIRMGWGGGLAWLGAPYLSTCHDRRKYIGPQSVCVETAVWQCRETAGEWGGGGGGEAVVAGDRNRLPPQQSSYFGEAAVAKEAG